MIEGTSKPDSLERESNMIKKSTVAGLTPLLVLIIGMAMSVPANACQIPVFRYALEKWLPDPFEVTVIHKDKLTADQSALVERITKARYAKIPTNLTIHSVVDANELSDSTKTLVKLHPPKSYPWMIIEYPEWVRTDRVAFSGPLDSGTVDGVFDSPARRQIVKRLIDGESAIWVLIESGDKAKDDAAEGVLTKTIADAMKHLTLPIEEIKADKDFQADTVVKLQIAFSVLRVSQKDPAEAFFVAHLLNSEPDLFKYTKDPIAIPVFGRGRSYFALAGKGVTGDNLADDAKFLTSACSCTVKKENPGSDLVFTANWDKLIKGSALPPETAPEIAGLSLPYLKDPTVASAGTTPPVTDTLPGPTAQQVHEQQLAKRRGDVITVASHTAGVDAGGAGASDALVATATDPTQPLSMWNTVGMTLGGLLAAIVVGSIVIRTRQNKA
jgi:hypothetical protein